MRHAAAQDVAVGDAVAGEAHVALHRVEADQAVGLRAALAQRGAVEAVARDVGLGDDEDADQADQHRDHHLDQAQAGLAGRRGARQTQGTHGGPHDPLIWVTATWLLTVVSPGGCLRRVTVISLVRSTGSVVTTISGALPPVALGSSADTRSIQVQDAAAGQAAGVA